MFRGDEFNDGYVRVPRSALSSVTMRHVMSAVDLTIAVPPEISKRVSGDLITGYSEWTGAWGSTDLSMGWDWGIIDGAPMLLNQAEIRTNMMVVGEDQFESSVLSRQYLATWMSTFPWQRIVLIVASGGTD